MAKKCGLAMLLHKIFVSEKQPTVEEAGKRIGMKYDTLYSRLNNRVPFRPEEVRDLLRVCGDVRVAAWLLEGSRFMAVERPDEDIVSGRSEGVRRLHKSATRTVIEAVDLLREVERAISDDKIDHNDLREISEALADAEQALGALRAHINARAPVNRGG